MNKRSEFDISDLRDRATNKAIVEKLLCGNFNEEESSLVELTLIGRGALAQDNDGSLAECLFLAEENGSNKIYPKEFSQSLPIPLPDSMSSNIIKLLSFAYKNQPISKSLCLTLNPLLVNRDGALFDNLPYSQWTIDPLEKNRDAAKNPVAAKYHLGKRDAYNRFMGKDWYGRSLSIGNVAARAKYMLEKDENSVDDEELKAESETVTVTLAQRVLELEVKESRMAVAQAEERNAILNARFGSYNIDELSDEDLVNSYEDIQQGLQAVEDAKDSLLEREEALAQMMMASKEDVKSNSFLSNILSAIVDKEQSNAPYRGAIGYKPTIDTKDEMFEKSVLPYSSPFEMMKEIISEQLNADVIGCIIEDTSLFNGSTIFGGGVIIKRKGRKKIVSLNGEKVEFDDEGDDFGNFGIQKGEVMLVECDSDEAIGLALACNVGLFIEGSEWDRSKINMSAIFEETGEEGIMDVLPTLKNSLESLMIAQEGDGMMSENTKIKAPRGRDRDFSSFVLSSNDGPVFSTDNPVQSLSEFDALTVQDKAQLLSSLDSFEGDLPRPRQIRDYQKNESVEDSTLDPLDEKLLPLIDESVRRQILVREAETRGDFEGVNELESRKSKREIAKLNAEIAKEDGKLELAAMWEKEADFYATLRADVTQDEGSYSSYLDRDEWYERTRQKIAETNKKRFGSLLDGLE